MEMKTWFYALLLFTLALYVQAKRPLSQEEKDLAAVAKAQVARTVENNLIRVRMRQIEIFESHPLIYDRSWQLPHSKMRNGLYYTQDRMTMMTYRISLLQIPMFYLK
jgi:hypothetical protein